MLWEQIGHYQKMVKVILNGGKIIRLLEKNGVFLEVKIANQDTESDEPYKKNRRWSS